MTRINEQPSPDPWLREKSEKEKLKETIRQEIMQDIKKKKRRKKLACCFSVLLLMGLIAGLITAMIAKTGFVNIPLFSNIFYKTPTPQRVVSVEPQEIKSFEEFIIQKLESQVKPQLKPGVSGQKVDVQLDFTEKELTSFLKYMENPDSPVKNIQAAVTRDEIEIFGEISEPTLTNLTIAFKPDVGSENNLILTITKIKIGDLSLPSSWGNLFINKFLKSQLEDIKKTISKVGQLESIDLEEGKMILRGKVDLIIFTQN